MRPQHRSASPWEAVKPWRQPQERHLRGRGSSESPGGRWPMASSRRRSYPARRRKVSITLLDPNRRLWRSPWLTALRMPRLSLAVNAGGHRYLQLSGSRGECARDTDPLLLAQFLRGSSQDQLCFDHKRNDCRRHGHGRSPVMASAVQPYTSSRTYQLQGAFS